MKVELHNPVAALALFGPAEAGQTARERSDQVDSAAASDNVDAGDTLEISAGAAAQFAAEDELAGDDENEDTSTSESASSSDATEGEDSSAETEAGPSAEEELGIGELSDEEQVVVDELRATDRKVRAHEQAHLAAAGPYARGGPTYTYEQGPDGQQYAVGGEVQIDTSPVPDDPEATIVKARIVRAAALAPAEPSAQDRAVAAAATKMETQANMELREQRLKEASEGEESEGPKSFDIEEVLEAGLLLDLVA